MTRPDYTKRQCEILDLLCMGYTQQEIAKYLKLSYRTIQTTINRLRYKHGCVTVAHLASKYTQYKMILKIIKENNNDNRR